MAQKYEQEFRASMKTIKPQGDFYQTDPFFIQLASYSCSLEAKTMQKIRIHKR
jgi:hypothetical protein